MDPTTAQSRRTQERTTACLLAGLLILAAVFIAAGAQRAPATADDPDMPSVTQARICAALAVYTEATHYDWSQHAVIARSALNRYPGDTGPDCGPGLRDVLRRGFDPTRWQRALDAVDAVASGSYSIPQACARVNSVAAPLPAVDPGTQCVIAGLAFVEVRA